MFKLGLIINPYAGIGGSLGLKGSDGDLIRDQALAAGAELRAPERMMRALQQVQSYQAQIQVYGFAGDMGQTIAEQLGFSFTCLGAAHHEPTQPEDTCAAAQALMAQDIDLMLFAGGDGTARLIADAVGTAVPALGVPAGVKMHSGVYAVVPEAAGEILKQIISGQLVTIAERDVKDIDEEAFRQGQVRARYYGSLLVPEDSQLLQQVKNAGHERNELMQLEAAQELLEQLDQETLYLVGPGSTTQVFLQELGLTGTLLGVDALLDGELIAADLNAQAINQLISAYAGPKKIIVTAIGGQGHIFGRGNQQFTAAIIKAIGRENIILIAARGKILSLNSRPLLVDTNDPELDAELSGYWPVITGYHQTILYPVGLYSDGLNTAPTTETS